MDLQKDDGVIDEQAQVIDLQKEYSIIKDAFDNVKLINDVADLGDDDNKKQNAKKASTKQLEKVTNIR